MGGATTPSDFPPLERADAYCPGINDPLAPNFSPPLISQESVQAPLFENYVYAWGDNSSGQKLQTSNDPSPTHIERLVKQCIVHVDCGASSTWVVSENGDLWAGGLNDHGQISLECYKEKPTICHPMRLEEFETMRVRTTSSGEDHNLIVLSSGVVLGCGSNEFGQLGHGEGTLTTECVPPRRIFGVQIPISQVACGYAHSILLSSTGQVFTCGSGADGCLGRKFEACRLIFECIPSLYGIPIQQICSGPRHAMALSLSGNLYSWGRNYRGCLGLGPESAPVISAPELVRDLPPVKFVSAGYAHSLVIVSRGRVFTCGDNSEGQLGFDPEKVPSHDSFTVVDLPVKVRIAACGEKHTSVVSSTGSILTFGRNVEGQLGHEVTNPSETWKAQRVKFDIESEQESLFFYTLAAGRNHTVATGIKVPREALAQPSIASSKTELKSMLSRSDSTCHMLGKMIRPTASKYALLRDVSDPALGSTCTPLTRSMIYQKAGSVSSPALPQALLECVITRGLKWRPHLSQFQSFLSTSETNLHAQFEAVTQPKEDQYLPAGCSATEILDTIDLLKNSDQPQEVFIRLKKRLASTFADVHCLNCSFLLPTRLAVIDSEGLEEVHNALEGLDPTYQQSLQAELVVSIWTCLTAAEDYAEHFHQPDQLRFIPLILQTKFLGVPSKQTSRIMTKLVSLVFRIPESGKKALVHMFQHQYSVDIFLNRLLHAVKAFLLETITAHAKEYRSIASIWHSIILMHLLYRASLEWQSIEEPGLDFELRLDGDRSKVHVDAFSVDCISEVIDPILEHRLYREHTITVKHVTQPVTTEDDVLSGDTSSSNHPILRTISSPKAPAFSDDQTDNSPGVTPDPLPNSTTSASTLAVENAQQKLIVVIPPHLSANDVYTIQKLSPNWTFFLAHSWLCPLKFKRNVIYVEAAICQRQACVRSLLTQAAPFFVIHANRASLVQDALSIILASTPGELLKPLKVRFEGEQGVDEGGLKREFFTILTKTLFEPNYGMFTYNEETRTVWFNQNTLDTKREFYVIGVILGLALYNDILLDLKFPSVVYKKFQDETIGLNDLADIFLAEGKSFRKILDWPEDDKEAFNAAFDCTYFEVNNDYYGVIRTIELCPGGSSTVLTYDNRQEYVVLYVQYLLETSISAQFTAFKSGFSTFQTILVKSLSGQELKALLCGSDTLDFDDLKAGAVYEEFSGPDDPYIQDLWDILCNLTVEKKKKFLQFCTGSDRVPLGGLRELQMKIQKNGVEPTDRLPTAFTCFNSLLLPVYANKQKLERLLILAIEQSQGFGLQ